MAANFQDQYEAEQRAKAETGILYVFGTETIEDRERTMAEGHFVCKERDVCHVKKAGSQDFVVWIMDEVRAENSARWFRSKDRYDAWKKNQTEEPVNGTSLRMWPAINKAMAENLWLMHIRTVEDLAGVPDNLMPNLGMGGSAIRDKARAWLQAAGNIGKVAEQLAALNVRLNTLEEANAEKDKTIAEKDRLIIQLSNGEPPRRGPGRPPKSRDEEAA